MPRFYDTNTATESIPGIHDTAAPGVVILPDDNVFWSPLPEGMRFTYDVQGAPNGLEPAPPVVLTPEQEAAIALREAGVTAKYLIIALYAAASSPPNKSMLEAVDDTVAQIASDVGLTTGQVAAQIT